MAQLVLHYERYLERLFFIQEICGKPCNYKLILLKISNLLARLTQAIIRDDDDDDDDDGLSYV